MRKKRAQRRTAPTERVDAAGEVSKRRRIREAGLGDAWAGGRSEREAAHILERGVGRQAVFVARGVGFVGAVTTLDARRAGAEEEVVVAGVAEHCGAGPEWLGKGKLRLAGGTVLEWKGLHISIG